VLILMLDTCCARMPNMARSCVGVVHACMQVLGAKKKNLAGFSSATAQPHQVGSSLKIR